jgi:hypothetical protein
MSVIGQPAPPGANLDALLDGNSTSCSTFNNTQYVEVLMASGPRSQIHITYPGDICSQLRDVNVMVSAVDGQNPETCDTAKEMF